MNNRQRKKQFKRKYGFNPPKNMNISNAEDMAKAVEAIKQVWERVKDATQAIAEAIEKVIKAADKRTLDTLMRQAQIEDAARQQAQEIEKEIEEERRWQMYTKLQK